MPVISEADLAQAISECQGQRNPNANTCIKLAAFYIIRREMFGEDKYVEPLPSYSYAPSPDKVINESGTEFAELVNGRDQKEVWALMDEMMDTIHAIHPKLYNAVLDRLR